MKKRKVVACLLSAAMMAGVLSGCGGSGSGNSDSGKEKITFWFPTFAASDGEVTDEEFWDEAMDAFEEENNCEVKVEIIPWDNYEEKYLTGVNSNDGPDVGYLYMEMFYDYIDMGAIVDIDEYFTDEEKENYIYYDLGNIMNAQYALPVVVGNPRMLVANMDILNQAGVDSVPSTWDELKAACQAVKENVPDVAPIMEDWGNPHFGSLNEIYWPIFWSAGGEIVDADGNLTINSEQGMEATEFIYSLKEEGLLPDTCTSCDDTLEPFKNGEAAMVFCASSNALQATEIGAEVMGDFHTRVSEQPPITKDDEYVGDERYATLFTDYAENFQSLPVFKGASSMYDTLYKNLQSMMLGEMTPEEALQTTTDYYNENLK